MENQIFKATYSGVPVYEMPCKGVAVMRRRSDAWLNATQILKVAGFDKPQRTRVLEREVQKGNHEKVQGGYGKYQGTWVPIQRGIELSRQYGVDHLLQPVFDFEPSSDSPPLAPKHITAPAGRPKVPRGSAASASTSVAARAAAQASAAAAAAAAGYQDSDSERSYQRPTGRGAGRKASRVTKAPVVPEDEDRSLSPTPSDGSSSSRTPSPLAEDMPGGGGGETAAAVETTAAGRKRKYLDMDPGTSAAGGGGYGAPGVGGPSQVAPYGRYARLILDYFISEATQIPSFIVNPPSDFDPDVVIDEDGHTALHWACAMGRMRVIKLLLTAGADIFRQNGAGQTALMRSVMFTNNYDLRKFPDLFELLHRSSINIDRSDRTVFHYAIEIALQKNRVHAARYYTETILARLSQYPREVADILNFQDEDGDTALTLAARARSKRLVKILLEAGGNPRITNKDGKSAEDYILEDERFRATSLGPSPVNAMIENPGMVSGVAGSVGVEAYAPAPRLHYSETGKRASAQAIPQMTEMLEALAASFDSELESKERDLAQAHSLLTNIQAEISESTRTVEGLKERCAGSEAAKDRLAELEKELKSKMGKRYRFGWEKYVRDEEEREQHYVNLSNGPAPLSASVVAEHADLAALLQVPPSLPEACSQTRGRLAALKEQRIGLFARFVHLQSETGAGSMMGEYRKLIAMACGVPMEEVDEVLERIAESLEEEEGVQQGGSGGTMLPGGQVVLQA